MRALFVKRLILKLLNPRRQHALRRYYVSRQVVRRRGGQEPELALLKFLVGPGDSVADIGANVGAYTLELSDLVGPSGDVYAFEPLSENFAILQEVVRGAHLTNVRPLRAALGSRKGRIELVIPELDGFEGYYWAHVAEEGESGRRESADVTTLDALWSEGALSPLRFIKCDVEGGELEVIRGGLGLIRAQLPAWLLEVSRENSGEVFEVLKRFGYKAYVYRQGLAETEDYRDREFSNYFFIHRDSDAVGRIRSAR